MLTDKNATQFIEVMEPKPTDVRTYKGENYIADEGISKPYAIGDRVPVREEWRVSNVTPFDGGTTTIEYKDGTFHDSNIFYHQGKEQMEYFIKYNDWQPASTMPDWAVRTRRVVTKVEAKQIVDICGCKAFYDLGFEYQESNTRIDNTAMRYQHRERMIVRYGLSQNSKDASNTWVWLVTVEESPSTDKEKDKENEITN